MTVEAPRFMDGATVQPIVAFSIIGTAMNASTLVLFRHLGNGWLNRTSTPRRTDWRHIPSFDEIKWIASQNQNARRFARLLALGRPKGSNRRVGTFIGGANFRM
jgi:hypothetical protein